MQKSSKFVTKRPDGNKFAQHSIAQSVLPDHLELVHRTWRQVVDRHGGASGRSYRNHLPFGRARFPVPASNDFPLKLIPATYVLTLTLETTYSSRLRVSSRNGILTDYCRLTEWLSRSPRG